MVAEMRFIKSGELLKSDVHLYTYYHANTSKFVLKIKQKKKNQHACQL